MRQSLIFGFWWESCIREMIGLGRRSSTFCWFLDFKGVSASVWVGTWVGLTYACSSHFSLAILTIFHKDDSFVHQKCVWSRKDPPSQRIQNLVRSPHNTRFDSHCMSIFPTISVNLAWICWRKTSWMGFVWKIRLITHYCVRLFYLILVCNLFFSWLQIRFLSQFL